MQGAGQQGNESATLLAFWTFVACSPFGPLTISNSTSSPSLRVLKSVALDRREVDKNVFATLASNESIALAIVKPLDRTSCHATFSVPVHKMRNTLRASGKAPLLRLQTAEKEGRGSLTMLSILISYHNFPAPALYTAGGNIAMRV